MKRIHFILVFVIGLLCMGCENQQIPETDATKLYPAKDSLGESWGFINGKGHFVIQPSFDQVSVFSCGYAKVEKDGACKFIDKKGNICSTISFDNASDFYYGYSTFLLDGEYGLLDKNMNMVIQPHFKALGLMGDNGLIPAKRTYDSNYEYIDVNENMKIHPIFDYAEAFKDGIAIVKVSGKYGAINSLGDFVIQPTYKYRLDNLGKGLVAYRSDDFIKVGILNKQGDVVVTDQYYSIGAVSDGLMLFMSKTEWGYMDTKGEIVIPAMYSHANPFREGYAWVKTSTFGNYYCIDKTAKVIFELADGEEPITDFHNGLSLVQSHDSCKYVNTKGNVIYSWPGTADSIWDLF